MVLDMIKLMSLRAKRVVSISLRFLSIFACFLLYDVDHRSLWACSGIIVSHTPGAVDDATATTALYLIIAACRQFSRGERNLLNGQWKADFKPAHDPSSRTLGILGLGGIGLRTAELARAFPMPVVYHSRKPASNAPEWAEYCPTMEQFLQKTDVLSIHVPLNEQTMDLIGEKEIRTMKKGSIIVNTARGKVLNEDALIRALQDGHVRVCQASKSRF